MTKVALPNHGVSGDESMMLSPCKLLGMIEILYKIKNLIKNFVMAFA